MYELKVIDTFSAAHQLSFFKTGCERLHGHNWKVEVCVCGERLNGEGILLDFKELKVSLQEVLGYLDHRFLNELEPFKEMSPSSENLARWIAEEMAKRLKREGVKVTRVVVWESENACASYISPEGFTP